MLRAAGWTRTTGAAGLLLAMAAWPARADVGIPDARLDYTVYVGGVHVVDVVASIGGDAASYRARLQAAMQGFLGTLAPITADTRAEGRLAAGQAEPALYRSVATWRNQPRLTELRYGAGGVQVVNDPPPEREREPVPEALRSNTVDPLTAVVGRLHAMARGGTCDGTVPVFDGRQRYDLAFAAGGAEHLEPSDVGLFSGPAEVCTVTFKPLAGRWRADRRDRDGDAAPRRSRMVPMKVWLGRIAGGEAPVPVRLEAETPFGAVRIHLARYASDTAAAPEAPAIRLAGSGPPAGR